ncbi:hypothetical protein EMCG_00288 [[Emmonsia] crescens]|uniref:Uncharacterized protein n=1 Tax=[Emmonsia] crescens TaxID=73230 RepID=A0A0G2HZM6_9EURO|nr:hypothetical protein EMCG_00288 [Emmonsia crescens UAMH 3008]
MPDNEVCRNAPKQRNNTQTVVPARFKEKALELEEVFAEGPGIFLRLIDLVPLLGGGTQAARWHIGTPWDGHLGTRYGIVSTSYSATEGLKETRGDSCNKT